MAVFVLLPSDLSRRAAPGRTQMRVVFLGGNRVLFVAELVDFCYDFMGELLRAIVEAQDEVVPVLRLHVYRLGHLCPGPLDLGRLVASAVVLRIEVVVLAALHYRDFALVWLIFLLGRYDHWLCLQRLQMFFLIWLHHHESNHISYRRLCQLFLRQYRLRQLFIRLFHGAIICWEGFASGRKRVISTISRFPARKVRLLT